MPLEVFNPVIIMDGAVLFQLVMCAEAVFGDDDRQTVTGVNLVEGIAEADRVNLPAPLCLEQVFVGNRFEVTGLAAIVLLIGRSIGVNFFIFRESGNGRS